MASSAAIGAIHVQASIGTAEYVSGAKKIQAETKKTEAVVKSSFGGMSNSVKGFSTALATGLSIGLLSGLIKKSLEYANSIGDVAKQLNVTTKELQEFRYAAAQVGIDQTVADKGLEKLTITLSKAASGSTSAQKAFGAVGVTLADINSKSKLEIFGQIADQMNKQGGAARNAAAGNVIFGESFLKMAPLVAQGSKGINELRDAAERLGVVLSDQQIQSADETARKLDDVKRVLAANIAGVVTDNAQSIVTLASALGQLTGAIVSFLASNPTAALGILGALAGGRIGGLPGAALGGLAGSIAGSQMKGQPFNAATGASKDLLIHNLRRENEKLKKMAPGADRAVQRDKVINLTKRLNDALGNSPSSGNLPALPQFLAPKPPKTPKGRTPRTAKGPRDRSDDVEFQFAQELRRAQMDVLQAQQQLAGTSEQRSAIALQMLALDKEMQDAELRNRVRVAERDFAEGKITAQALEQVKAQAVSLQAENDNAYNLKKQSELRDQQIRRMERADELQQRSFEYQVDDLRFADEMATTQAEHRQIQLQIVDTLYKQKEAHLRALKAELELAGRIEEAADVQAEIDRLPTDKEHDTERVKENTLNPLEAWKKSIPDDAREITEAFQKIQAEGLDRLSDSLADVILGTKSLKEAAHEMAASFIADSIRMITRMLLMKALSAAIGGMSGGGTVGGDVTSSGIFPDIGFASGGFVSGAGGPKEDRVPAMLSAGEFVVNAAAARKFLPLLKALNEGNIQHRKSGGLMSGLFGGAFGALGGSGGKLSAFGGIALSDKARGGLPFGAFGKLLGFSEGGMVPHGLPIARASYGQPVVANENNFSVTPISLTFHNDFRGVDASSVAKVQAELNQLRAELPSTIVGTVQDAKQRFIIR